MLGVEEQKEAIVCELGYVATGAYWLVTLLNHARSMGENLDGEEALEDLDGEPELTLCVRSAVRLFLPSLTAAPRSKSYAGFALLQGSQLQLLAKIVGVGRSWHPPA